MKIAVTPGSFADPAVELLCRRRLTGVLARYADLLATLNVRPTGGGVRVEVEFGSGVRLAVEQAEVGTADAVVHLADRVGRAVARRIELWEDQAVAGFADALKISKQS